MMRPYHPRPSLIRLSIPILFSAAAIPSVFLWRASPVVDRRGFSASRAVWKARDCDLRVCAIATREDVRSDWVLELASRSLAVAVAVAVAVVFCWWGGGEVEGGLVRAPVVVDVDDDDTFESDAFVRGVARVRLFRSMGGEEGGVGGDFCLSSSGADGASLVVDRGWAGDISTPKRSSEPSESSEKVPSSNCPSS